MGNGDHYAARESDTGFAGAVNSTGGYGASVPLDLPGARGGLNVPVRVVHGGRRFGAAGLGWDVPLSSIRRDVRIAHRRPANIPDARPQPREQLSLDGMDLVRNAENTAWVARRNNAQLEVRDVGGGVFEMVDGNGLRYSFSSDPAGTGHPLDNGNLYLLQAIFGPGATHVHLTYTIGTPGLAGGVTGLSIDLASVSYNYDSTDTCAKHQVSLVYDNDEANAPLSLQMLGSTPLVRMHKLHAIDVTARESAADSPQPCSGPMRSLRTYNFSYLPAADTGQLQLHRVTMSGQENTDERALTLPVATYTYGQVTSSDGIFKYELAQQIPRDLLPVGTDVHFAIASTHSGTGQNGSFSQSLQSLLDINGDGRPDLLYNELTLPGNGMTAALNKPDLADPTKSVFTPIHVPSTSDCCNGFRFSDRRTQSSPRQMDRDGTVSNSQGWMQMVDMNADGRVDLVIADEVSNFWVVYLNNPNPHDANHFWERRLIDIRPLMRSLHPCRIKRHAKIPHSVSLCAKRSSFSRIW